MKEEVRALLEGGYDLHTHPRPSHAKRCCNDYELLNYADKFSMEGILIKNHYESTAGRAALLNDAFHFHTRAYGAVVLNYPTGGINPYAVESAMKLGGRVVWLPTRDAKNSLMFGKMKGDFFERPGITVVDERGKLKKEVYEVMEVVKKYDGVLATGHISPEESVIVCEETGRQKIKTILTHPDWFRTKIPLSLQIELGKKGVILEKVWANYEDGDCSIEDMLVVMKELSYEHIILTTDRGQADCQHPVDAMASFLQLLLEKGVEKHNLKKMTHDQPKYLME